MLTVTTSLLGVRATASSPSLQKSQADMVKKRKKCTTPSQSRLFLPPHAYPAAKARTAPTASGSGATAAWTSSLVSQPLP